MKKMMLLALAAASVAMFALPAVASAGTWHAEPTSGATKFAFTAAGGTAELLTTAGNRVHCTSNKAAGEYENTTTGTITLTFHGCTGPFGASCTSSGQPSGTIVTTKLPFHNVHLEPDKSKPGILITPASVDNIPTAGNGHFATFSCFGISTVVRGNGILGEVTSPKCGETSATSTLSFARASAGHQKWTQITTTGTVYDLNATVGGGSHSTASMDGTGTVSFGQNVKMNCT